MGRDKSVKVKGNHHYTKKMYAKLPQGSVCPWEWIGVAKPRKTKKTKR